MPTNLTPASWLKLLEERLAAQQQQNRLPDRYYEGDHRMAFMTTKWREAFGGLFTELADNWCEIVVDAAVERLKVQGFRFGSSKQADDQAWQVWQANGLDAESNMLHTETIKLGKGYWLVDPTTKIAESFPRITAEHPDQMIVATAGGDRRARSAALKKWLGDDGFLYATLYLPDVVYKWRSKDKVKYPTTRSSVNWTQRPDAEYATRNPLGVVPVVPLHNKARMLKGGVSDLKNAIPLQDAINKELADMLIASEYAAFPQRVATGVEVPKDPETNQPLPTVELKAALSRLWVFANPNAKVQDLQAADLSNYVNAIEMLVQHFSAQTRTPPHYLLGRMVNVSGDALKAAETGLVARVNEKKIPFGEGHEEAVRLAFRAMGEAEKANQLDAETIWGDSETRSFGELVDGLTKLKTLNLPDEILWEKLGMSPQEIARAKSMQMTDSLLAGLVAGGDSTPPAATPPAPTQPADAAAA